MLNGSPLRRSLESTLEPKQQQGVKIRPALTRRRARCEDRIRCAKNTGLRNLPLHTLNQNRLWCAVVALAADLTAWMQLVGLNGSEARRWEPKRLRLRLFTIPAVLLRHGRRTWLKLKHTHPWAAPARRAITALRHVTAAPG